MLRGMTRTQILLPDELYRRAKELAAAKEISLAELIRRGLELLVEQYPSPATVPGTWKPPVVRGLGWKGLTHTAIRGAARRSTAEDRLEAEGA
jgi:hypothetical protein